MVKREMVVCLVFGPGNMGDKKEVNLAEEMMGVETVEVGMVLVEEDLVEVEMGVETVEKKERVEGKEKSLDKKEV